MKQNLKRLLIPSIGIILLLMLIPLVGVNAASSDTSQGSFQINAGPDDVTGVDFQTNVYVTDEALDPDASTYQRLNFTVTMASGIGDVSNITIWIFDDSAHNADYNSTAVTGYDLVEFTWINSTDVWSVADQGSCTEWSVDTAGSDDPGTDASETTFEFSMRFQISRAARADTTDWNASVHVFDGDDPAEVGLGSESTLVTMNENYDTTFSIPSFSWGSTIQPNSVNNTHQSMTLTIYANAQWEVTLSASNFTAAAQTDVDPEVNDIIVWDVDGSQNGISKDIRNTTAVMLDTWDNQAPPTDDTGIGRDVHIFLNPAALFIGGVTWYVTITATSQADT